MNFMKVFQESVLSKAHDFMFGGDGGVFTAQVNAADMLLQFENRGRGFEFR
jgi:hypothetical protein